MKSLTKTLTIAVATGLAACSVSPYYQGKPWAKKSFDQASAECYTEMQQQGGPPSYDLCMNAKGWQAVERCQAGARCAAQR